tara:strand:- start:1364 stop:1534 length:171 start_codon:yes stop_codon:yes gene_type:complete
MKKIINNKNYYIKIRGYYRKDGTWVSSHYRRIKYKIKSKSTESSKSTDPNQLSLTF